MNNNEKCVAKQADHLSVADQMSKEILDRFNPTEQNEVLKVIRTNIIDNRNLRISHLKEELEYLDKSNSEI